MKLNWNVEDSIKDVTFWKEGDELMAQLIDPNEFINRNTKGWEEIFNKSVSEEGRRASDEEFLSKFCLLLGLDEGAVRMMLKKSPKRLVPLWEKSLLTLEEAAAYSGIGINKLRTMTDDNNCSFVFWNQSKRMIKRVKLDEYLDKAWSI